MRKLVLPVLCAVVAVACSGGTSPTAPTPKAARLSRTRFFAFGDSITAGEVTQPISSAGGIGKLVLVPAASYPSVLQGKLTSTYTAQAAAISVTNAGLSNEPILDGIVRF